MRTIRLQGLSQALFGASLPASRQTVIRLSICLGVLCLAVYGRTLAPTLAGGDSGELTTAAYTLGVAHPPGYPLYTLLGKAFSLLPYGSIAWRLNLFSAVCNTAAVVVLLWTVWRWSGDALAGFTAAAMFAFSPLAWRYALVAEVFALNTFLVCCLLYGAVAFLHTQRPATVYLAIFTFPTVSVAAVDWSAYVTPTPAVTDHPGPLLCRSGTLPVFAPGRFIPTPQLLGRYDEPERHPASHTQERLRHLPGSSRANGNTGVSLA